MGELMAALQQMLVMITIIAMGLAATKLKLLDDSLLKKLTRFLVYVPLPCMILGSVSRLNNSSDEVQVIWTCGLAVLLMALSVLSTVAFNFLFRTPKKERVLYLFMSVCTNMGFIGISVASAIYGGSAVFSASVFVFISNVSIFSLGFMFLDKGRPKGASLRPKSWKEIARVLKSLLNPATVSCMLAMFAFLVGLPIPSFAQDVLNTVGGITAPMAMMLVGVIVAGIHPAEMIRGWRIYAFIAFRQLLVPIVALFALHPLGPDATALRVFVIMAAMPIGSMAPMLVTEFGYDSTLVAKATVLSTVSSFVIVPLLMSIVMMWA